MPDSVVTANAQSVYRQLQAPT